MFGGKVANDHSILAASLAKNAILAFMFKYVLILISAFAYSQAKNNYTLEVGSDTTNISYSRANDAAYDLHPIENSKCEYAFRVSYWGTVIAVYRYQDEIFGDVQKYTREVKGSSSDESFKMTFTLTADQAHKILTLIDLTKIKSIPSQKFINGWSQGFDGIMYTLEEKKDNLYSYKTYWTPRAQDVSEAKMVENFVQELNKIIEADKLHSTFVSQVPFDSFSFGGVLVLKIYTRQQLRERKRLLNK